MAILFSSIFDAELTDVVNPEVSSRQTMPRLEIAIARIERITGHFRVFHDEFVLLSDEYLLQMAVNGGVISGLTAKLQTAGANVNLFGKSS